MCWFGLIWFDWDFTVVYHSKPAKVTSEAATAFFWCEMQLRISCVRSLISCSSWLCLLTFHPAVVAYHAVMGVSVVFSHIPSLPMVLLARALDSLYSYPFQTIWISIFLWFNFLDTFCSRFGRSLSVRFYCLSCGCGFGFNSYQI